MKGRSKDRTPSKRGNQKPEPASGLWPRQEVGIQSPEDRNLSSEEGGREAKPMNVGVVGESGTEGEIPRGPCGERNTVKTVRSVREEG